MSESKTCFVIAPIGGEGSETRKRSDTVFKQVVQEVVENFGYECKRADHIEEPGIITNQVIEYIVESELVVADLTNKNPNVFYELAVRHAHEKPVIQLINSDQDIPFDVATQRTININLDDFSTTKNAQEKIENQIEEIESNEFEVENPVSVAGHIRDLRESGEPEKQQLAEFTELLNEINSKIHSIEKGIEDPQKLLPPEYLEEIQNRMGEQSSERFHRDIDIAHHELNQLIDKIAENEIETDELKKELKRLEHRISRLRSEVVHKNVPIEAFE